MLINDLTKLRYFKPQSLAPILGVITMLLMNQANASIIVKKNFRDLVQESDAVVEGTISKFEAKKSRNDEIVTRITLNDLHVIIGKYNANKLKLVFFGGSLENGETQYIVGAPKFDIGERVILFVKGNGRKLVPIVGVFQGVFRIQEDAGSGKDIIKTASGLMVNGIHNDEISTVSSNMLNILSDSNSEGRAFGGYTEDGEEVLEVSHFSPVEKNIKDEIGISSELFRNYIRAMAKEVEKNYTDLASLEDFQHFSFKRSKQDIHPSAD